MEINSDFNLNQCYYEGILIYSFINLLTPVVLSLIDTEASTNFWVSVVLICAQGKALSLNLITTGG
jgi:hypothetical protein